ncbi:MAG: hypothetical protein KDD41_12655 [Flavobacteriales bacterium]|nr:hypothetical protein [Flavobacteriales bacterium]
MLDIHSILRWLVAVFLLLVVFRSIAGVAGKKPFTKADNLLAILLLSFTHIQFLMGLALYYMMGWAAAFHNMGASMKDSTTRFWSMEHAVLMVLAIVLITMGRVKSKKAADDLAKHKKGMIFYSLALLLILWAAIVKPFLLGRGWL